jgi:glycosyltransferase involved in cell wall biosynthesis
MVDGAPRPILLSILTLYRYKNVGRLIRAFASARVRGALPHTLRIVGADADVTRHDLRALAQSCGVSDSVDLPGGVPHDEIPQEYERAAAFIYPSMYETFGHPALEAMVARCPVIAARTPTLKEVCGGAAELFDPESDEALANSILRVLQDPKYSADLIKRGSENVQRFSWERAASETLAVLGRAASDGSAGDTAFPQNVADPRLC